MLVLAPSDCYLMSSHPEAEVKWGLPSIRNTCLDTERIKTNYLGMYIHMFNARIQRVQKRLSNGTPLINGIVPHVSRSSPSTHCS